MRLSPLAALLASLALLSGCSPPQQQPSVAAAPVAPSPAPPASSPQGAAAAPPSASSWTAAPRADTVDELMAPYALDSQRPQRLTLYSWTTEAQARDLARTKTLLVKGSNEAGYRSPFEMRLQSITTENSKLVRQLRELITKPPFDKQRYAFANPIGWSVGVAGKPYGPVLLQINLRKEAIYLSFAEGGELWPLQAHSASGEPVSADELTRHPERIAVFFNEQQDQQGTWFREYIVFNEGMVESWSLGTDAIKAETDRASAALARLARIAPPDDSTSPAEFIGLWRVAGGQSPVAPWARAVGVASPTYVMTRKNVEAVQKQLASAVQPPALTHQPPAAKPRKLPQVSNPPPLPQPSPQQRILAI